MLRCCVRAGRLDVAPQRRTATMRFRCKSALGVECGRRALSVNDSGASVVEIRFERGG